MVASLVSLQQGNVEKSGKYMTMVITWREEIFTYSEGIEKFL